MSDKARYYLEKSVPELEDLERKKLFNKKEINQIMRKWTDFEHRIMSRGSKPSDYLAYVKYEKNLEKLRKARAKRMQAVIDTNPSISDWSAERRIMFVFERGIRKYPQSMELWANYIKYAKKNGSIKVVYKVYSRLLQHHPRNVDAWLSAAKYEYDSNKNVASARNLLRRCLRFNGDEERPWMEFLKFEMNYLSKLLVRRKLFNLLTEKQQLQDLEENEHRDGGDGDGLAAGEDIVDVEAGSADGEDPLLSLPEMNANMLGSAENNPVLKGDLILTLYDVCVATLTKRLSGDKFDKKWELAQKMLGMVDQFEALDREHLDTHIVHDLLDEFPQNADVVVLDLTLPLRYTTLEDEEFVAKLQSAVKMYQAWAAKNKNSETAEGVKRQMVNFVTEKYLTQADGETKQLLNVLVKKLAK